MQSYAQALRSSIGRKLIMALTGSLLAGWTVLHMLGNLLVFAGPATLNRYGALLQNSPLVWVMRGGLLLTVGWHMSQAWKLGRRSVAARGSRYKRLEHHQSSLSGRTMALGGVAIAAFVVYHLLHIYGPAHADYRSGDVYHNVVIGFRSPVVSGVYLIATAAFCAHLRHGLWSALRSLGVVRGNAALRRLSALIAIIVGIGFAAPCVASLVGALPS